jgi:hypothetical protein
MKKITLILVVAFGFIQANCQFYYSDIISNQVANSNYLNLKNDKIKRITITNIPNNYTDKQQDGVTIQQIFTDNWKSLNTQTNLTVGLKSSSTTTYENNRIVKKVDEAKNVNSIIYYEYNAAGKLASIISASEDTSVNKGFTEKHIWNYDDKGLPNKMYKIKNGADTTAIIFLKDEQNNIAEERWMKAGKIIETYYYYYNDKNLLTDIVKFNLKVERMLPEFLFDYDVNNRLIKMTQIPFGSDNYIVWHYSYNEKDLKLAEFCYSKKGELLGQMDYSYQQ